MSAIARYFLNEGVKVYGYDIAETPLTRTLQSEGIKIHHDENVKKIPSGIDLVVVTPAIPESNKELKYCNKKGLLIKKRAEVLGMISKGKKTIAIAGTHGKTTTSAIVTHILRSKEKVTAFLGGILAEEQTNFIHGNSDLMVVEADEYDRSFMELYPDILVITSMDADHLDIYGSEKEMYRAYEQLTYQIKKKGILILGPEVVRHVSLAWAAKLKKRKIKVVRILRDFDFENIRIEKEKYVFDATIGDMRIQDIQTNLPGIHNIINTTVAILISKILGIGDKRIKKRLKKFKGIKRRFEIVKEGRRILIDDYAHHPEEIRHAVKTAKDLYTGKKVLGIFQPHLYSRTRDFYKGFARELSALDAVILLPIYPARELPIKGVESKIIYNLITLDEKYLVKEKNLIKQLKKMSGYEVVMTLGAADLDKYHQKMIKVIKK